MSFWIIKTEPSTYSLDDLIQDKTTCWDGVRNYQARNNLSLMKKGDLAMVYHSVGPKELVGVVEIIKEAYPDPTDHTGIWKAVDIKFIAKLKKPLTLAQIKQEKQLENLSLVKQGRLSVALVPNTQWRFLLNMSETKI